MEKILKPDWLPVIAGGLLVICTLIPAAVQDLREAIDHCGNSVSAIVCPEHDLPPVDLPHPDHPMTLKGAVQTISPMNVPQVVSPTMTSH
jgi:LmbE family N-acetylglucosaminyl deacetylase